MRSQDWKQLVGRIIHGNTCHWLVTKVLSIFNARRSTFFRILCSALVRFSKSPQSNDAWEQRLGWSKSSSKYRNFDRIDREPMEFEWHISQDSIRCSSVKKSKFTVEIRWDTWEFHRKNHIYVDVQWYFLWIKRQRKGYLANAKLLSLYARRFGKWQWSFTGPGSEKKWYCISEECPLGVWDNIAERMLVEFAESGCPIFRAASPLSRGQLKSNGHGKLSIHDAADLEMVETFRIIVSANQLSLYGALVEICEEYESLPRERGPIVRGAIEFFTRALCDQDRSSFGLWWPSEPSSSIAAIWRTNWKPVTTRQIE